MNTEAAALDTTQAPPHIRPRLDYKAGPATSIIFVGLLAAGLLYTAYSLMSDVTSAGVPVRNLAPFLLLAVALLIALGFEFVNGFHDTANAVATVIYTHSLEPHFAVVWSGFFNFLGVVVSSGAVAFGIISLLPVELILQASSKAGFAMVFALLVAAIIWNLGTWYFGLPASSSHTMIGSIIGVGIANQLMAQASGAKTGTSGVDWDQALKVGKSLLLSPFVGFLFAFLLLYLMKAVIKNPKLYEAPEGTEPPPLWIRALLVLTCTGVSFAHGSNDGQKGMGLIMLILVGTVPTAYALNHAITPRQSQDFIAVSQQAANTLSKYVSPDAVVGDDREEVTNYVRTKQFTPNTMLALRQLVNDTGNEIAVFGEMRKVPNDRLPNLRNDMYLVSEALRLMEKNKQPALSAADWVVLNNYKSNHIDKATRFIPTWVKVAVAMALGLGTMVGWKRIVVTVGEKIGKEHLTYAQGASAELVAMGTILAADNLGLPVSTTHVLSSGIAGTMAANRSGLQMDTLRNLLLAWVLTLPVCVLLGAGIFAFALNVLLRFEVH